LTFRLRHCRGDLTHFEGRHGRRVFEITISRDRGEDGGRLQMGPRSTWVVIDLLVGPAGLGGNVPSTTDPCPVTDESGIGPNLDGHVRRLGPAARTGAPPCVAAIIVGPVP
jgi:hypothetical protein